MKTLLASLLLTLLTTLVHAQAPGTGYAALPKDSASQKVTYTAVVPVPGGITPAQAFGRAKIWLADAFASKAILADDPTSGLLSGGGTVLVKDFSSWYAILEQVIIG